MKHQIRMLRFAYWTGAVLDGLMLLPMLSPKIGAAMFGMENFQPGSDYRYAMAIGASLMAGWTVLLIWADRKPLERRGVILITLLPAMAGLIGASVYALSSGLVSVTGMIPTFILQGFVVTLFLTAYIASLPEHGSFEERPS